MALHWSDNVHTTAFTPRDYQVELLAAAVEKNIIICLGHNSSKEFIALKLIQELAYQIRSSKDRKVSLYLTNETTGESAYNLIYHLTDLKVFNANLNVEETDWSDIFNKNQVVILSPKLCLEGLKFFQLENVNLIIVEDCHKEGEQGVVHYIFENYYRKCRNKPKVLGLAGPLHSAGCLPGQLRPELEVLENSLDCKAETASDIVTVLRYCTKPAELILQCNPLSIDAFISVLEELVTTRKAYLNDHRFDPSEIYSDDFLEELQAIPDPKKEPNDFLDNYLKVLHEMGPWCADRAALHLLAQIEKQKVKTPYERNFLLLCLVSTTFVQIRAFCDYMFQKLATEKERIEKYSSPKILRLLQALKLFKPEMKKIEVSDTQATPEPIVAVENVTSDNCLNSSEGAQKSASVQDNLNSSEEAEKSSSVQDSDTSKHLEISENNETLLLAGDIEKMKLNENLGDIPNSIKIEYCESHKQLETTETVQNDTKTESPTKKSSQLSTKELESAIPKYNTNIKRPKRKFLPGSRYKANQYINDPDALCGILFCNDKNTAKILFNLLYEASRNDPDLGFLKVQYTVDRVADPLKEAKEAEIEHRKQEEVLKRFRMHECNLLVGTAVLEEGIDLPKCNLVIRWDPPSTYRSYVQCKGRARASQAFHMILVGSHLNVRELENETLCDDSHHYVCSSNSKNENLEMVHNFAHSEECPSEVDENSSKYKCEVKPCGQVEKVNKEAYEKSFTNMQNATDKMVESLAQYIEIEKMLLKKCANVEPPENEHEEADKYNGSIEPYKPLSDVANGASVNLGSAIALINRYCAKLPSDTFTKLTPIWRCAETTRNNLTLYQYTLRLPINSRLKRDVLGIPMPTKVLARRIAALIACRELHRCNELDDSLQPIGKEAFRAAEPDWENFELEEIDEQIVNENLEPRPGTTKRRQYYYKRIASEFSDCRPYAGASTYLYNIKMTLECPIPEEQNTRGRKIYPPEDAVQGFGIMTLKKIPKVSAFPIFTRSGEVKVSLELSNENIILTDEQIQRINHFLNFTFTNVLRLQKYLMLFDPEANENCFFIVPTIKNAQGIEVDWNFLDVIYNNTEKLPKPVDDDIRKSQAFDPNKFKDAVVMPWYRNQDQPQYFYVAEICYHLSPESSFPGENYSTFKEYYFRKYGITIQNAKQPLLDVDHTSARLNFLTPRYVNRKGVALPTSSEETKRAKRENLEQKQILVPELCTIHPFPASLWRAAVCLPCIIYRINALLLADEIRKQVSYDIGLGKMEINHDDFEWPILDFGWSLSEVLRKSREANASSEINLTNGEIEASWEPTVKENGDGGEDRSKNNDGKKTSESDDKEEKTANDLLEEADEKLKSEHFIEIGTWSNDMADNIMGDDVEGSDEEWGILPPNVNLCSRNNTKIRYGSPTSWDVGASSNHHNPINSYYSDSDASFQSDDDYDMASVDSSDDHAGPIRIEFKANNVAEAIETEEEILKREKQLAIIQDSNANEMYYQITKNMETGFDCFLRNEQDNEMLKNYERFEQEFLESIENLRKEILISGMLVKYEMPIVLPKHEAKKVETYKDDFNTLCKLVPYISENELRLFYEMKGTIVDDSESFKITLDDLIAINKLNVGNNSEKYTIIGTGDIFDNFSDSWTLVQDNEDKSVLIDYNSTPIELNGFNSNNESQSLVKKDSETTFSFDYQPDLVGHPGPSPSIILQALTMSNANDGINLERLETIGDSFLKYAITTYLYCTYEDVHEGKLSHLRSKQVSNLNLYRLGRRKVLGECMIATKFEPHDNWLPPCYYVPKELEKALIDAKIPACHWNLADLPNIKELCSEEICELVRRKAQLLGLIEDAEGEDASEAAKRDGVEGADDFPCFIPYNLVTQHSIPDKSVADCVEALIGAYLIECGPRGALLFMAWLGIRVLPINIVLNSTNVAVVPGSTRPDNDNQIIVYGEWTPPKSPLLVFSPNASESLNLLLDGYAEFEAAIGYYFEDRAYLLQAMTHASYSPNRLSDCYQRLEFLGDAVLDYLITRHLYEDPRQHSPGALTDLRSALVNNTIFASLAVRHGFHKYFRHLSPGLNEVIDRFVRIQHENGHSISEEYYLLSEEECDDAEDVEVPKALGDVFESVAGAIFLDSNMSLDTVWKVYSNMMRPEIEQFSNSVPKSPIRELLELEPETAKFGKPEKLADGRRVRVTVEVFGKGTYRGIGRNYRIAKCTAAKCALRQLKKQGLISKKH